MNTTLSPNAMFSSYGDNFVPVLHFWSSPDFGDTILHTPERPFCPDPTCPCKEDQEAIAQIHQLYLDGLVTQEEATSIIQGRMALC